MNTLPPEPSAKDPISATFMKALMRYIRANTIINGQGYKTSRGPNGTTLKIDIKKQNPSPPSSLPWTFSCSEDPETGERKGGWTNCRLQVGLVCDWVSPDLAPEGERDPEIYHIITGTDLTDDGEYYLGFDLTENKAAIMVRNDETEEDFEEFDPEHNKVLIKLGTVSTETDKDENKKVVFHGNMHVNPVIYRYV